MSKNISAFTRKQNIKNAIDKIITKTFGVILYPLRFVYKKYDGSDLQSRRNVKKAYKKLKNNIYSSLLYDEHIYITDFFVGQEDGGSNIISINEEAHIIHYYTKKSYKVIFDEIEDILRADESLVVESIGVRDLFKYGYFKEDGRVIKVMVMVIDKEEK